MYLNKQIHLSSDDQLTFTEKDDVLNSLQPLFHIILKSNLWE